MNNKRILRRWQSRGGKYFVEGYAYDVACLCGAGTYTRFGYSTDNGGGCGIQTEEGLMRRCTEQISYCPVKLKQVYPALRRGENGHD